MQRHGKSRRPRRQRQGRNEARHAPSLRSADPQSAVSQNSVLPDAENVLCSGIVERPPIGKSAIRQTRKSALRACEVVVSRLRKLSPLRPTLGIVLGTGFGAALEAMKIEARIDYARLPGFPAAGVAGHPGELLLGRLGNTPVIALNGRAHFYEGHSMAAVTFPVRALAAYGVRDLLLTNAAGGVNRVLRAGDFMVVCDHINFMGANPLRGTPPPDSSRFIDMTRAYDEALSRLLRQAGRICELKLRSGVYLAVSGPSFETPAEIRAFARFGADAVGMSTVPEVIVARQCGLRVAAISCITNLAAGRTASPLSHAEVLETATRVKADASRLLAAFARLYTEWNRK